MYGKPEEMKPEIKSRETARAENCARTDKTALSNRLECAGPV
jgi:hypothetical protein